MKTIVLALFGLFAMGVSPLLAGSDGTAVIKGRSGTGRTLIELHTSDIGVGVKYLKVTIDEKSYEFDLRKEKGT